MRSNNVTAVAAVVALLVIVGGALPVDGKHHHHHKHKHNNEKSGADESARLLAAPGREYLFRYDAQTTSGYAPWISTQRAINRLQALVHVRFHADDARHAAMWMGELRVAQQNDASASSSWNVGELQPLHRFDHRMLPVDEEDASSSSVSAFADALRMPIEFEYTADGQVGAICFDADELQSTVNVKKAVLNMLQVNVRMDNDGQQKLSASVESEEFETDAEAMDMLEDGRLESVYTNVETTIEGQCEAVYTVSPSSPLYSDDELTKKKKIDESFVRLNVTKSMDFGRCQALVDIGYGIDMEPSTVNGMADGRQLKDKHLNMPQFDAFATPALDASSFDRKTQGASVIATDRLDRSTVYRYVLIADRKALKEEEDAKQSRGVGIERVEALSEYVFRASGNDEPMQTVAVAQLVFLDSIDNAAQLDVKSERLTDEDEDNKDEEAEKSKKKSADKMDWSVEQKKSSSSSKKLNKKLSAKKLVTLRNAERKCSVGADLFDTVHSLLYSAEFESLEKRFFMYGDEYTVSGNKKMDERKSSKKSVEKEKTLKVAALFVDHLSTSEERHKAADAILRRAVNELRLIVDAYARNNDDGAAGINAPRIGAAWTRCVTAVRALSVNGLREMRKMIGGSVLANELFADALAIAATRNTIDQLAEIVVQSAAAKRPFADDESSKGDDKQVIISQLKARQLLKSLGVAGGLPAPSNAQCDAVLRLCKSDALSAFDALRRDCWLAFGAMVGELQRQNAKVNGKTRTPTGHMEVTPAHKMELYKQVLLDNVNQALSATESSKQGGKDSAAAKKPVAPPTKRIDAMFETIVALKALGNARMPAAMSALMDVALDAERPVIARLHAVDALRSMPSESHASLMPIYANRRDRAEIRMAVAALIFANASPKVVLADQIAFTLRDERDAEVKAFTYSLLASYARAGHSQRRQFIQHLQAALTLCGVDYEAECRRYEGSSGSSTFSHIPMPWSSTGKDHGLFANIVSIFGSSTTGKQKQQPLPIHLSVELDAMLNGEYMRNAAQFSLCQHKLEKLVGQLFNGMEFSAEDDAEDKSVISEKQQKKKDASSTDGHFASAISQLSDIFANLRLGTGGGSKMDLSALPPYAIITIRHNNVDVVVLPLTADTLLDAWKSIDGKPTAGVIRRVRDLVAQSMRFMPYGIGSSGASSSASMGQLNTALPLYYRSARLPTVVGLPLKIVEQTTVFGWLRSGYASAGTKSTLGGNSRSLATVSIHPNLNVEHRQSMHVWLCAECGAAAGVASQRVAEVYVPLTADVGSASPKDKDNTLSSAFVDAGRKWTVSFQLPERNTRLFGAHSLPVTFVAIGRSSESIEMEEAAQIRSASGRKLEENKSDGNEEEDTDAVHHDYDKQHVDPMSGAAERVAAIRPDASSSNAEPQIIDSRFGDRQFKRLSLPFHIHGFHHPLADASTGSTSAMVKRMLSGAVENSLHVDFEPLEGASPKAIRFTWIMKTEYQQPASAAVSPLAPPPTKKHDASFGASWMSVRDQLVNFYAKFESAFFTRTDPAQAFDEAADSEAVEQEKEEKKKLERYVDAHATAHDYLTRHLIRSQKGAHNALPLYRRSIDVGVEALGAVAGSYASGAEAKLALESICDLRHRACEWRVRARRTPLYSDERSDWTLDATLSQIVYPERVKDLAELIELESASKNTDSAASQQPKAHFQLLHQLAVEWGSSTSSGARQSVRINLLAEPSAKTLRRAIDALKAEQRSTDKARRMKAKLSNGGKMVAELRKSEDAASTSIDTTISRLPVLDQFNAVASYRLEASVQRLVKRVADAFKTEHYWTASVQPLSSSDGWATDGVLKMAVGVDPLTIRPMATTTAFANVSWETATERVRIEAVPLRGFFGYSLMESPKKVADAEDNGALKRFLHSVASAKAERDGRPVEGRSGSSSSESDEDKEYADELGSAMCTVGGGASDDASTTTTTVDMFEGGVYDAPSFTDCYTVLAKDCGGFSPSNRKQTPRFAVLMSRFGDAEHAQKRIKIITHQQIVVVEPLAAGDARLRITVEDATLTKTFTRDGAGERQLAEMAERGVELTRRGRTASTRRDQLVYAVPKMLNVEFDGRTVKIQLAEKFQSGVCGLCGLDGADDRLTKDIERLFTSYSIQHGEENCKPLGAKWSSSSPKVQPKVVKSTVESAKRPYDDEESVKQETEPTERTAVVEYNQKVCFSLKPVASCPDGWWPTDADGRRELLKSVNVQFACLERSSIEAKRLRAQARRVGTVRLADYAATYHELMQTPEQCVQY